MKTPSATNYVVVNTDNFFLSDPFDQIDPKEINKRIPKVAPPSDEATISEEQVSQELRSLSHEHPHCTIEFVSTRNKGCTYANKGMRYVQSIAAGLLIGVLRPMGEAISTRPNLQVYTMIEACQHEQQRKKRVVRVQLKPMRYEWDEDIAAVDEALMEYNFKSDANH